MPEAIETFSENHPEAWGDTDDIEKVDPAKVRGRLGLQTGALDVLVGGPPCQGFSINAPDRFLTDPRNKLFKDYLRFVEEFEPKTFLFENVPGLLSLDDGKVFRQIVRAFEEHDRRVHPCREDTHGQPGLVLALDDGGIWRPESFTALYFNFTRRIGMKVRFHDLRHTHASQLLRAGISPKVVSERLGTARSVSRSACTPT